MTDEEMIMNLKQKKLPTYGTKKERMNRLKKAYNIPVEKKTQPKSAMQKIKEIEKKREERRKNQEHRRASKMNKMQ